MMNVLTTNNKKFIKQITKAINTECNAKCNAKYIIKWITKWKEDYKNKGYKFMTREKIFEIISEIILKHTNK